MDLETSQAYFPFLDTDERQITAAFCSSCDDPSSPNFDADLNNMLNMIKRIYQNIERLPLPSDFRSVFRSKLMNIAGIYTIIPPHKVLDLLEKNNSEVEIPSHGHIENSLENLSQIDLKDLELSALELIQLPLFSTIFKLYKEEDEQYLDDILKYCKYIVFKQDIKEETFASSYLTSTSEPLTQTIVLNLQGPDTKPRDFLSLCFDIIYQTNFLKVFYSQPNLYKPTKCEKLAREAAEKFSNKSKLLIEQSKDLQIAIEQLNSHLQQCLIGRS